MTCWSIIVGHSTLTIISTNERAVNKVATAVTSTSVLKKKLMPDAENVVRNRINKYMKNLEASVTKPEV